MDTLKALILGIVQGITEFLPVSSSGHIELGKALLNLDLGDDDLTFSIILHFATVLSTIVVFRHDIWDLIKSVFSFKWNDKTKYVAYLVLSAIPVGLVGVLFKDQIEQLFHENLLLVGCMLIVTAILLYSTTLFHNNSGQLNFKNALLIGVAQAVAIIPGISRSGATISTALNLGVNREEAARFSFLMVLLPIIGASLLEIKDLATESSTQHVNLSPYIVGFLAAFISGWIACRWMLKIVKQGKIQYFAYYCLAVGLITIIVACI